MWDELKADSLVGEAKLDKVFLQAVEDHMERSSKRFAFSLPVWRPCHADQSVEEELVRESAARRSMRSKLVDWVQRCSVVVTQAAVSQGVLPVLHVCLSVLGRCSSGLGIFA